MVEELRIKTKLLNLPEKKDEDTTILDDESKCNNIVKIFEEYKDWYSSLTIVNTNKMSVNLTYSGTGSMYVTVVIQSVFNNYAIEITLYYNGNLSIQRFKFKTKGHIRAAIESSWMIFYSEFH